MNLELDHLTIIAPSLEAGVAHVRERLGIEMSAGGKHPEMSTHNRFLRLGDGVFLEVIAVDPEGAAPARPRWFGLDDADAVQAAWDKGRRLRAWVARTCDLDGVLARHGNLLGQKTRASRGDRFWLISVRPDGSLPMDGIAPCVIDWGGRGCPAAEMPDVGARLISFSLQHPEPLRVAEFYRNLGVVNPPQVRRGPELRFSALIDTPAGRKELH